LAKRLSEKQKEEISLRFTKGENIESLSRLFDCNKLTITRNLKKTLGDSVYQNLIKKFKTDSNIHLIKENVSKKNDQDNQINTFQEDLTKKDKEEFFSEMQFVEVTPLNLEIDNLPQKELSSKPISEIEFPTIVYIIVDKKIELEIKILKDYPQWHFLPNEDLDRKTIEIFNDLQTAKKFCNKEKKVIKVPNSNVFKIVAPVLLSRGISRIINDEQLVAL